VARPTDVVKRGIERLGPQLSSRSTQAKEVEGRQEIAQSLPSRGDVSSAKCLANAMTRSERTDGPGGVNTFGLSSTSPRALQFDKGFLSPYFVTPDAKAILEDATAHRQRQVSRSTTGSRVRKVMQTASRC